MLSLALSALMLATPAAADPCHPRGSRTLVENREARIYLARGGDPLGYGDGVRACSFHYGRRVRLASPDTEQIRAPLVANRRWVVFSRSYICDGSGCLWEVAERSLRTGRLRFDEINGGTETCDVGGDCGLYAVGKLLLRPDGVVAWIACDGDAELDYSECIERPYYLLVRDHRGVRDLDKGRIRVRSLHFTHHKRRIAWTNRGVRHSARLR
jgi:hypothetical protein